MNKGEGAPFVVWFSFKIKFSHQNSPEDKGLLWDTLSVRWFILSHDIMILAGCYSELHWWMCLCHGRHKATVCFPLISSLCPLYAQEVWAHGLIQRANATLFQSPKHCTDPRCLWLSDWKTWIPFSDCFSNWSGGWSPWYAWLGWKWNLTSKELTKFSIF